jgi:hypothetical protein
MNVYYQKYIKYKTKYLEIKYGGSGKGKKAQSTPPAQKQVQPALSIQPPPPRTPVTQPPQTLGKSWAAIVTTPVAQPPQPPQTPDTSFVITPSKGLTPGSTVGEASSTPRLEIDSITVESIIEKKSKLTKLLTKCLLDYVIRPKITGEFYINFKKNDKPTDFAHFSFHVPDHESLNLQDIFSVNSFHLKLNNPEITYNLRIEDGNLVLQSIKEEQEIISLIGCENYYELIKIKNCLENILNKTEFKSSIEHPVSKILKF